MQRGIIVQRLGGAMQPCPKWPPCATHPCPQSPCTRHACPLFLCTMHPCPLSPGIMHPRQATPSSLPTHASPCEWPAPLRFRATPPGAYPVVRWRTVPVGMCKPARATGPPDTHPRRALTHQHHAPPHTCSDIQRSQRVVATARDAQQSIGRKGDGVDVPRVARPRVFSDACNATGTRLTERLVN